MLKGYLLGNFKELIPALSDKFDGKKKSVAQIAQILRECLENYIIYYDQRRDELKVFRKKRY
jgi:hypothetical protein